MAEGKSKVTARALVARLVELGDPRDASFLQGYFKTGPGQYGEGDRFLGIRAATLHQLSRDNRELSLAGCRSMLRSPYHEARVLALLILVRKCERADDALLTQVYQLYLANTERVNNWDLVDASAPGIVGRYLWERDRSVLLDLARSESVWERRIAIIATLYFIRHGHFDDTFRVANLLLSDEHDLIHKAVGWMLREVGKRDRAREESFLRTHHARMPRTMLRYAIEKFPEPLRQQYLRGEPPP